MNATFNAGVGAAGNTGPRPAPVAAPRLLRILPASPEAYSAGGDGGAGRAGGDAANRVKGSERELVALALLWQVEQAQAALYDHFVASISRSGRQPGERRPDYYSKLQAIRLQERRHLAWIAREIAWHDGVATPSRFTFGAAAPRELLAVAGELAELSVASYLLALSMFHDRDLATDAFGVLSVEARRAAYLAGAIGGSPFPNARDVAVDPAILLATLGRYRVD
jgi:hypothetical protein